MVPADPLPGPRLPEPRSPLARHLRRAAKVLVGLLVALGVLWYFHASILTGAAYLFREDNPAPSDAIVVLLGGIDGRPQHAAELYRRGIAPRILLGFDGVNPRIGASESYIYRDLMVERGVPRDAVIIVPEPLVSSTKDESDAISGYIRAHPMRRITVATTAFHTRRSRWIFRRALKGLAIDVRAAAADDPRFTERSWWKSDEGLVTYVNEAIKLLYYYLKF